MIFGHRFMDLEKIDILELIPQRPPFVMIDRLVYFDEVLTKTRFQVREDNIFVEDGRMTPSGLIENIAQTCAARMGYINCYIYKKEVKLGFIGAIKDLQILRRPLVGEELITSVEVTEEVFQMTLVKAEIESKGEILVSAIMKIALSDIDSQA